MDVFSYISLFGGTALFLYGMNVMSGGLEKIAGGKLEKILKKITSNKFKGLLFGAVVTTLIQSSSAVTVMLVGLVNSGIMSLSQAVSITMGSNIGTTFTAWILSLTGIESTSFFVKMLNPKYFSPLIALVGAIFYLAGKSERKKYTGSILLGFAILMYGMNFMTSAVSPLSESESFRSILVAFSNPILGVLAGLIFTAVVQSSSASVGVLQALALTGAMSFNTAVPIILGQNIGTCVSAFISSFGTTLNAKRVAVVHILFNTIGSAFCLILWWGAKLFIGLSFADDMVDPWGIAVVHTVFNVLTTIILFPMSGLLEKMACKIVREKGKNRRKEPLDERLLSVPSVAVAQGFDVAKKMSAVAGESIRLCITNAQHYNKQNEKLIEKAEKELDVFEDKLGTYLVKVSQAELTEKESNIVSLLLRAVGEFERIGDHSLLLMKAENEIEIKEINFSESAKHEIAKIFEATKYLSEISLEAFAENNPDKAKKVKPLEIVISEMARKIRSNHIARLKSGECSMEQGFVLSDILVSTERISSHLANLALAVIETSRGSFSVHEYTSSAKKSSVQFNIFYREFKTKYKLN